MRAGRQTAYIAVCVFGFAIVAFVVILSVGGAKTPTAGPLVRKAEAGAYRLRLVVTPDRPGPNILTLHVIGASAKDVNSIHVLSTMLTMSMVPQLTALKPNRQGGFAGTTVLPMGGAWQFELLVSVRGQSRPVRAYVQGTIRA